MWLTVEKPAQLICIKPGIQKFNRLTTHVLAFTTEHVNMLLTDSLHICILRLPISLFSLGRKSLNLYLLLNFTDQRLNHITPTAHTNLDIQRTAKPSKMKRVHRVFSLSADPRLARSRRGRR